MADAVDWNRTSTTFTSSIEKNDRSTAPTMCGHTFGMRLSIKLSSYLFVDIACVLHAEHYHIADLVVEGKQESSYIHV